MTTEFAPTDLRVTDQRGEETIIPLEDGSGFNCARGNNVYVTRYYVDYGGGRSAEVRPAKKLETVIRRIEKKLNFDLPERMHVTVAVA